MVLAALLRAGKVVLRPFGDNQRYDIVIDDNSKFLRIQCKTGRLKNGTIKFKTCSTIRDGSGTRDYLGQADLFGVYCPETDSVYLIPVDVVGKQGAALRVTPAKNNQKQGVRLASEFKLG